MRERTLATTLALVLVALLGLPGALRAQEEAGEEPEPWENLPDPTPQVQPPPPPGSGPVTVAPGAEYAAVGWKRFLLGSRHRDLWTTPLTLPVLDLGSYGGGLEPENRGGTSQSITLHMMAPDGREYHFRSVNKWTHQGLPPDLKLTPAGHLIQDQTSALHPTGALVVPPLLEAAGILHVTPTLYVMPDDPRLGEWRETFAGMVGIVEEFPNEGEDDEPLFADSRTIAGMDRVLEHLEEDPGHRVNVRAYLKARLVDLLIGDPDRGDDQWRWARYGQEGSYVWEPIPRDRDWAFVHGDGLLPAIAGRVYPKFGSYRASLNLKRLMVSSSGQDRWLLAELPRSTWEAVAAELQADLTDAVIAEAAGRLPDEYGAAEAERLAEVMRARRDRLDEAATEWYRRISREVDVHATDGSDRAEVERRPDGSVEVRLLWPVDEEGDVITPEEEDDEDAEGSEEANEVENDGREPAGWEEYFRRRFLPAETDEVRVYLHGGDDRAVVRGAADESVRVRVIGGGSDDLLADSSSVGGRPGARTAFYDHRGENTFHPADATTVDTRDWEEPEIDDWFHEKRSDEIHRDWGEDHSWAPVVGFNDAAGLILGARYTSTRHGFRRLPHARQWSVAAFYGIEAEAIGAELEAEGRPVNSALTWSGRLRATQLESMRFYGFGNDTPEPESHALAEVRMEQATLEGGLRWDAGTGTAVQVGPVVRYTRPVDELGGNGILFRDEPLGSREFGQAGARLGMVLDQAAPGPVPGHGVVLAGDATGYAPIWDAPEWFGRARGEGRSYLTLPVGPDPVLATRLGGVAAWGTFPVHEAAFVGGRTTLRGYRHDRFAGDRAAYGNLELRVPLARITLLTRGQLGVSGLADAGRVWVDGESPGGWHTSYGAGVWFASLQRAVSVTWARGEEDRFYVQLGLPF